MLIGVVSDSHDDVEAARLAAARLKSAGVNMIIHLGDIEAPFTLKELASAGVRIEAVFGNNDGEFEMLSDVARSTGGRIEAWPRVLEVDNRRLLIMHGRGPSSLTVEIAHALAESGRFSGVLYGHTHEAELTYVRGVLVLNPGPLNRSLGGPSAAIVDTSSMAARLIRIA